MYWQICLVLHLTSLVLRFDGAGTGECTDVSSLKHVMTGVTLKGHSFMNITSVGIMTCAKECRNRIRCRSLNFNSHSDRCELNDVETIQTDVEANPDTLHSNISDFPRAIARSCAQNNCSLNQRCESSGIDYFCVTEFPSSCADVKLCSPNSEDGEYWVYLANFDMKRVPVYCHQMSTDLPLEYVSTVVTNYGIYPELSNQFCGGETNGLIGSCADMGGEVWFSKIRVNIQLLEVIQDDYTFAQLTNIPLLYGVAQDCYSYHEDFVQSSCGPVGQFFIDLRGTGFAVAPEVEWVTEGWKAFTSVVRSSDGTQVNLTCGGFPGYCVPDQSLRLIPNTDDVSSTAVTEVSCNL